MYEQDSEIRGLLQRAAMPAQPEAAHVQKVHDGVLAICRNVPSHRRRNRIMGVTGVVLLGSAALAIGGTQAGRDLVLWMFTPVATNTVVTGEHEDGGTWMVTRSVSSGEPSAAPGEPKAPRPFTADEQTEIRTEMSEVHALRKAGAGRLVGWMEGPGTKEGETIFNVYKVEYTLSSGKVKQVGQGVDGTQAETLRIAELNKLRDEGAGQILFQMPFPIGLGRYVVRFTFADGATIDLRMQYPPGPRQEREAIFAETRALKEQLQFTVQNPSVTPGTKQVWGVLRYKLADGRTVGITEQVPPEALTADGKYVAVPATDPVAVSGGESQ